MAIKADGSLVTWGKSSYGGMNPNIGNNTSRIYPGTYTYVAVDHNGVLNSWGATNDGGASWDHTETNICSP